MNLKNILTEAEEQAEELMTSGNSHEKAQGYGMQKVINRINNYLKQDSESSEQHVINNN